jgi:hypothetical protein
MPLTITNFLLGGRTKCFTTYPNGGYMKAIIIMCILFSTSVSANGVLSIEEKAQGTARVDEAYTKKLKAREQTEKTRQKMQQNPRNPAFVEGFEEVAPQKQKQGSKKTN